MATTFLKNPVDSLLLAGTAAAETASAGTKPPNTLTVTGTPGQATTGTGVAAGAGADVSITAGAGGAAPSGAVRGSGGSVTINPGAPGGGAGTAASYGDVMLATTGGRVAIGSTAPTASLDITGSIARTISGTRIGAAAASATFAVRKANTGVTPVGNAHEIGNFVFSGFDGVSYVAGARIRAVVEGAVSTGSVPMALAFSTDSGALGTDDGTIGDPNVVSEQLRITSAGLIGIGTVTPSSKLHVIGGVQVGTPTGGDQGPGSLNVAGEIYQNGTPILQRLEEAYATIEQLKTRLDRLEASLSRGADAQKND